MFVHHLCNARAASLLAVIACGPAMLVPPSAGGQPPGVRVEAAQTASRVIGGWGEVINPDNDCAAELKQGILTMKIPGTDHTLSVERKQMNAPRILQTADGDFIAQVKVGGQFPKDAASVVPERRPCLSAGLLLWADDKNYVRLERGELVGRHCAMWELRKNGEFVKRATNREFPLANQPTWFRLERRGGTVYASVSTDDTRWSSLTPIAVELPAKVQVGVIAGHNTSSEFAPTFEGLQVFRAK